MLNVGCYVAVLFPCYIYRHICAVLVTRDEFAAHADAAMRTTAKYRGHLFGLIKHGEMHGLGTSCKPRIFHERRLLKLCAHVDAEHSRLGSG